MKVYCYHCGDSCDRGSVFFDGEHFCCNGCKTVYQVLSDNDMTYYYELQPASGTTPSEDAFEFLDNPDIADRLLDFQDGKRQIVTFYIPNIHCSSCIWVLENLRKLSPHIISSTVHFAKKTVRISFETKDFSLKSLAALLSRIGYRPHISLDDYTTEKKHVARGLIYRLAISGFAFGNVMLMSFPEYFDMDEVWLNHYKPLFRWLMLAFSLPVVFYCAQDYFTTAIKSLRRGFLGIDVPIALGILTLFSRSVVDITFSNGSGFFDSLTGLVFFLILGRIFQQKTYDFLSFERNYKSYFPIAVSALTEDQKEISKPVYKIQIGDRIIIKNEEIIPVDGVLISQGATLDYSFVTGESRVVQAESGDKIFAGAKQIGSAIEMTVSKSVNQSYLTQLWSDEAFFQDKKNVRETVTNRLSKYFTWAILVIALAALVVWWFIDLSQAFYVFTAVLIVACPCALALSAPFTFGNLLRIFGSRNLYLKEASLIEQLAHVDTIVFDKTGTLTSTKSSSLEYRGLELNVSDIRLLKSTVRNSNHPLSRMLYGSLPEVSLFSLDKYEEKPSQGIVAMHEGRQIRVGNSHFVMGKKSDNSSTTSVHISIENEYKGQYVFQNNYRPNIEKMLHGLEHDYELVLLSGDNDSERGHLLEMLPKKMTLIFDQSPRGKLDFIKGLQKDGKTVMMIGDGLNDSGALAQSAIGVAVSEDINTFSPACDAIIDADRLYQIGHFLEISRKGLRVLKWSFFLSLVYNLVGLTFAVLGYLSPIVAAILMPISSITVVVFVITVTTFLCKKI